MKSQGGCGSDVDTENGEAFGETSQDETSEGESSDNGASDDEDESSEDEPSTDETSKDATTNDETSDNETSKDETLNYEASDNGSSDDETSDSELSFEDISFSYGETSEEEASDGKSSENATPEQVPKNANNSKKKSTPQIIRPALCIPSCSNCARLRKVIKNMEQKKPIKKIYNAHDRISKWPVLRLFTLSPKKYFRKYLGTGLKSKTLHQNMGRKPMLHAFFTFIGAFIGICIVFAIHQHLLLPKDYHGVIGSMGASAVLVYGAPSADLAQPYNMMVGNTIGAVVGVCCYQVFGHDLRWLAAGLAVALTTVLMHVTKSLHPPGGATALVACISEENFIFIIAPVWMGFGILLIVAFVVNNFAVTRSYPKWWY
eukprot:TRINITY_DN2256_c0_g2_i1.p1 TRINITY_DN2256_c0_g2~~TRINITY_DN2256_c0_g2_i1.p1  ORF type:complete len:394 (-),score=54.21 TRINITY_DN2256_c0_g2_i1:40-1161(-)